MFSLLDISTVRINLVIFACIKKSFFSTCLKRIYKMKVKQYMYETKKIYKVEINSFLL